MKQIKTQIKGGRVHRRQIRKRIFFITSCFCLALLSLIARLYQIQVLTGTEGLESLITPGEIIEIVLKRIPVIELP